MVERPQDGSNSAGGASALAEGARILILESHYYAEITRLLISGAMQVLTQLRCEADLIAVPGALELPQALAGAVAKGLIGGRDAVRYDGAIVLGCVIRGETAHYDIVCNNAIHWLMETAIRHDVPLGNAILTVDNKAQAIARATGGADGKGGDAARACLRLVALKSQYRTLANAKVSVT